MAVQPRRGTFVTGRRSRRHREHHRGARRARGLRGRLAAERMDAGRASGGRGAAARGRGAQAARRSGLADALRRAHPPLHLGGRRQPATWSTRSSATSRTRCGSGTWCSTACPAWATRSTTRRTCSRRCSPATAAASRTIMREHVLEFQREILAAFSRDLTRRRVGAPQGSQARSSSAPARARGP